MTPPVTCMTQGERETSVRKSIVETRRDPTRRDFSGTERMDDAQPTGTPRADKRAAAGEAWTDEMTDEMDIALWCGTCFDAARRINGVET